MFLHRQTAIVLLIGWLVVAFGASALASVCYPKIVISLCVIPIDSDSLAISRKRALYPAHAYKKAPEVVVGLGKTRLHSNRPLIVSQCLVDHASCQMVIPEVVMGDCL